MVDDDDDDESPSPEPQMDSRSALPRGFRAWWRLRIVKRDDLFSLIFSLRKQIYRVGVGVGGAPGGPRGRRRALGGRARPHPRGQGVGPMNLTLSPVFFIFSKSYLRGFSGHSENFCFLHNKQHHDSSAENSISMG